MSPHVPVVLHDVSFHWPDGSVVLDRVSGSFSGRRTGLVGANGAGKSTLLRLVAGELAPTSGLVTVEGSVAHLRQDITRRATSTTADLLGITERRAALRAIEAGATDPVLYDVVGADWDIEERAASELGALGLPVDLDRSATALSGGEAMLAAITGVRLSGADVALLDEPTNNLDRSAREALHEIVRGWRGTLVVASHDVELLELMDETAELRAGAVSTYGGPYAVWREHLATQQEAARQALRTAEQTLRKERMERIRAEERIAHSERKGRKDRADRRFVPAVVNDRRNSAEKSQAGRRSVADARIDTAREAVTAAGSLVRDDGRIVVDLPDPQVPRGRRIAELVGAEGGGHIIQGPERVALTGANGVGKTRLLEQLLPTLRVRTGYLPQRVVLDPDASVLDVVARSTPHMPRADLRNRLARLLIRGAMVDRPVRTLSGGERFRVALAGILLADPPPELVVLDEPTNDLDIDSVDQLVAALSGYRGALLVVSHDERFLERLDLNVRLVLGADGSLATSKV